MERPCQRHDHDHDHDRVSWEKYIDVMLTGGETMGVRYERPRASTRQSSISGRLHASKGSNGRTDERTNVPLLKVLASAAIFLPSEAGVRPCRRRERVAAEVDGGRLTTSFFVRGGSGGTV